MKLFPLVISTFGLCCLVYGANKYSDYTLLRVIPHNTPQLKALNELVHESEDVDILKRCHGPNDTADILVAPSKTGQIETLVNKHGMSVQSIPNYGKIIDAESEMIHNSSQYNIFGYNSYDMIQERIRVIANNTRGLVRTETLCTSYEGRIMKLIKISSNHRAGYPIIFIDAGAHAREWAAPAFAMYIAERLTTLAEPELGRVDWYILPVANPDGYEYTRADPSNRMWRKTRSETWREECFGVDLNRNYGYKWGYSGASFDPCEFQVYAGRKPFSEREARLVRKVMLRYSKRIKLYLSVHTYGDYLIYPWAYTGDGLPSGWKKLHRLAEIFSNAVVRAGGKSLQLMSAGQWYPSAGASIDFAFAVAKIPYSYVLEITNGYQFVFPVKLIPKLFPKYYAGLIAMINQIKKEFAK